MAMLLTPPAIAKMRPSACTLSTLIVAPPPLSDPIDQRSGSIAPLSKSSQKVNVEPVQGDAGIAASGGEAASVAATPRSAAGGGSFVVSIPEASARSGDGRGPFVVPARSVESSLDG